MNGINIEERRMKQWTYTTSVADVILAIQDGRRVEVQVGPPDRKAWTEPAPVEIAEGRRMRVEKVMVENDGIH